ncbi:hypothetical protein BKA65DRAFT_170107 [Rhexocercosporidium sp. MPI-PUGE-AT-0058]|nr:hypothetical protein BKA65DRAFT_170107 [Rhexocercosporidium sp. MPI-PUGE-AT-0058]
MPDREVFSKLLSKEIFKDAVHSQTREPIDYVLPFFEVMQLKFLYDILGFRGKLLLWKRTPRRNINSAEQDSILSRSWHEIRGMIECIERMHDEILEFMEATTSHSGPEESRVAHCKQLETFLVKQNRLIRQGWSVEQHIRDVMQVDVGNLSLQESRKSTQQANSIGRISIMGFVFVPLSLVMSFFGMNIRQLAGTGASWRAFLISAAAICLAVMLVCVWLWRRSKRTKFYALMPFIVPGLILYCLLTAVTYPRDCMRLTHFDEYLWAELIGFPFSWISKSKDFLLDQFNSWLDSL